MCLESFVQAMKIYTVGGAVRDLMLGRPVRDRDYVVVGAAPEDLLAQGFRPIGRDFPVFLHPKTQEEYALARIERKTGKGYAGFAFDTARTVTLEEDLRRRDLTINAMALDEKGTLIDPYGGQADLSARILRHVSSAFSEDPVRLLRVARFAARFQGLGFVIAPETLTLMRDMVVSGEVDALVPERVFQEIDQALGEAQPQVFFTVLRASGALKVILPEIDALFGVPQDPRTHPEVDTGDHTLRVLRACAALTPEPSIRFSALVHDLGKALTPAADWPSHPGHEVRGLPPLESLGDRLRLPSAYLRLARKVVAFHGAVHKALSLGAEDLLSLLESLDGFRNPEGVEKLLIACTADARGRPGHESDPYPQADRIRGALERARSVRATEVLDPSLKGPAFGAALRARRLLALKALAP